MIRLEEGFSRTAILVPLSFEAGTGRLVVIAGAMTPIFGSDEVARLIVYSVAVTAALDRTRLVEAMQAVNAELESRVDERTAALRATNDELAARHEELQRVDQQRRDLLARVVSAQEEERRRIAHDLHDDAVQVMTAVNMRVGVLRDRLESDSDREIADKLEKTVSMAIGRLRHLLFELSPPALETRGLATALRHRLEELAMESPFTYELHGDPDDQLDAGNRLLVYRIAQEALVNVRKHADAKHVRIDLEARGGGVLVRIKDDGRGFDPATTEPDRPGHLGLAGMRERADMGGGWWRVDSAPGNGTTVEFWTPGRSAPTVAAATG
jgi:signal transduction histidine kinase